MCGIARRAELASCTDPSPPISVAFLHMGGASANIFLKHRICKMNETMKCFIDTRRQEMKDETRGKLRKVESLGGGHYSQAPSI